MERLLFAYAGVGLATGAAALALLALAPFWEKRYAARFRCIVWLALAVRLLVPFAAPLPAAAPQPLLLELPASLPDTARAGETQAAGAPPGQAAGTGESVASVPRASDRNTEPEIKEAFGTAQAAPREPAAGVPSAQEEGRTEASGASRKTPVLRSGEILLPAPARLAGFVWLAGVGVCALWHLAHYAVWRARTFHWNRPMESSAAQKAHAAACRAVRMRRAPGIYANAAVPCPMAVGVLRPVVLVPEALYESPLLEWMLRHELTHIKRGHIVCKAVLLSACAVHWYNPAVWLLARRCEKDLEFACDEAVLHGTKLGAPVRAAYGEALLAALKAGAGRPAPFTTCFAPGKKMMLRRFSAIFSKTGKRAGRAALACILCLAALAGSFVACSAEQPPVSVKSAESEPKAAALPAQAGSMENVKEHWLVYGASVYPGRDGECVMAYNSADGSEVYAPAPRWEGKRNILYGGSYWPREDAWFTAACDADEEHPGRVTLYTSRDGGAQWTAQPLDLVGEGQNTPIENIYCMEVVRDDLFYLITGVYAGTGESQTAKLWLWRCEGAPDKPLERGAVQGWPVPLPENTHVRRARFVNASVGYITAGYEMGERFTPQPNVLRTVDGGQTWQRLDFRAALHDAPYGGYLGCCIFMQGTTTEIRCFTPLNGITLENVSLVSEDFGETWNWYPRMYVRDEAGTITAIRYFTDKADGLRLQLEECEKQLPAQPDAAPEEEHAAWCERLEKAIARQEAERT